MKEANQILLDLKRKIYKPVYFLCGEEPHYIDVISDYIENNVLSEADKEFNQTVVYGKEVDLGTIISYARQFPMMSEYNVVLVKEAQNIKEFNKGAGGDDDETPSVNASTQLIQYLKSPQPTTILVFAYKYKVPDKRSALTKLLMKEAVFFESKRIYDNQVPDWITSYAKEKNHPINAKAAFLLAEFLGNDLSKISNEVNKLLLNLKPAQEITPEHVQEFVGISKDYNVFELQDALGKKEILKANRIIQHFAGNEKENPSQLVLASLYSYFTRLLRYQMLEDKSKGAVAAALGINPFFVDGIATAARNYPTPKLKVVFALLKEYDLKSKGVDNPSTGYGELLKEMVFKMLH